MKTEAWWVCHCGDITAKVGKKGNKKKFDDHSLVCKHPDGQGYCIKQVPQRKRDRELK